MQYKFSKATDKAARKKMNPQYGAEPMVGGDIGRPMTHAVRMKAQIDRREIGEKLEGKKKKRGLLARLRAAAGY